MRVIYLVSSLGSSRREISWLFREGDWTLKYIKSSPHLLLRGALSSYPWIGCPSQSPADGAGAGS